MTLTRKQEDVLSFIIDFSHQNGESPTFQEIQNHFGFKSLGSVNDYIQYLKKAGYLKVSSANTSRSLEIIEQPESNVLIPVLGKVAAGSPLTIMDDQDFSNHLSVPESMVNKKGNYFALEVEGESMIEDGIFDGDYVIIKSQKTPTNGQTVVAVVDNAATIKRYYKKDQQVELHPANPKFKPLILKDQKNFQIQGVLVALWRRF